MDASPAKPIAPLDADTCQRALAILVDVGTTLALECKEPDPKITLAERTRSYARCAEAVRRTILLHQHLTEVEAERSAAPSVETKRALVRKRIIRAVEDSIQRDASPADAEALRLELLERIDSPEFDADIANRPPEQLIAELCRDMALAALPGSRADRRRTPDDIAVLCAQAAAPAGSGLPQWVAAAFPQAARNDAERDAATRDAEASGGPPIRPDRDETTLCDHLLAQAHRRR